MIYLSCARHVVTRACKLQPHCTYMASKHDGCADMDAARQQRPAAPLPVGTSLQAKQTGNEQAAQYARIHLKHAPAANSTAKG
jgi:hypothetical protein